MAHVGMLSWSAQETGRDLDLRGLVDASVDPLPGVGGRELVALGRAVVERVPNASHAERLAETIGPLGAVQAAGVAANFEIMNRVVDAVGLPLGRGRRRQMDETIELLGTDRFPHAAH
ncbi:MAG: hypothetical protein HKN46_03245 [Acidimicrobiia bacterium]|nr:hypothetical protein [Acidimicrobiia bacterium]